VVDRTGRPREPHERLDYPAQARFLAGQRFDLRVEGQGTGAFSSSLKVDGAPVQFTSGAQGTTTTDGISSPGYGGFNTRAYSSKVQGVHTLEATFSDESGSVTVSSTFEIVDVGAGRSPIRNLIVLLGDGMGVSHRTAARLVRYGSTAGDPNGYLAMDQRGRVSRQCGQSVLLPARRVLVRVSASHAGQRARHRVHG